MVLCLANFGCVGRVNGDTASQQAPGKGRTKRNGRISASGRRPVQADFGQVVLGPLDRKQRWTGDRGNRKQGKQGKTGEQGTAVAVLGRISVQSAR